MTVYVLDTDHLSLWQRGHPAVLQRIAGRSPRELAITLITVEEQLRGWLSMLRRAPDKGLVRAYSRLHRALEQFHEFQLLDFTKEAVEQYGALRQQKIRVGTLDLRIASIVLALGAVLVTRNHRDFSRVPNLSCEDWSQKFA